ncbi:uncharacterized protein LOC131213564 [Anopheles bellator]|uniref:uncharacterized protein LOC131213564 n=1 Tax=Anopheles bellator TaxID=139047 RepID=UPI00264994AE|nr:uncharacterized protein LOC131213564 [Anopheles bellator]
MALRSAVMVCLGLLLLVALPSVRTNPIDTPTGGSPASSSSVRDGSSEAAPAQQEADASNKALPEGSKMSKFLDDFTSAFKQGTAKMKESLESAASSVKDGVLQGYDYVRSKLTGVKPEQPPPSSGEDETAEHATSTSTAGALTSEPAPQPEATGATAGTASPSTRRPQSPAISSSSSGSGSAEPSLVAFGGAVGVSNEPAQIVPNDDDDDERIIFNDKDYKGDLNGGGAGDGDSGGDRDVTETPVPTTSSVTVDNRFIIAGPLACKSGQEVVNGKCRNIF